MGYEELLIEIQKKEPCIKVSEKPLKYGFKGLYKNNKIIIDKNIKTNAEKKCILAEELGHHYTSVGNILDQSKVENRKQEKKARRWAFERCVSVMDLVKASKEGIRNRYELAEYLDVTEEFLQEALNFYKEKYGLYYVLDNYIIYFEPLGVLEKIF